MSASNLGFFGAACKPRKTLAITVAPNTVLRISSVALADAKTNATLAIKTANGTFNVATLSSQVCFPSLFPCFLSLYFKLYRLMSVFYLDK